MKDASPPKSRTAISAASTEPAPATVANRPVMSVSTPILIAGSRNCCALAASGHAAADPTSPETKSRRRMPIPQQTIRQILAFNSGHQNRKLRPAKWVMVHFAVRKSMAVSSGLCQLPPAADMRTVWAWGSCLWPGDKLTGDFGSEPDAHLPAIVACFVVWREICHPAFSAFCNKICHKPTLGPIRSLSARARSVG